MDVAKSAAAASSPVMVDDDIEPYRAGVSVEPASGSRVLDQASFRELYPALRRFAAAISSAPIDPDDLVQDALAAVLRRDSNAAPIADLGAYLRTAVLNSARSAQRRFVAQQAAFARSGCDVESTSPVYPSDLGLLDGLRAPDRALLYLTAVEGWSFADVASLLNRPEASLRMRATRLRRALHALLVEPDDDGGPHG